MSKLIIDKEAIKSPKDKVREEVITNLATSARAMIETALLVGELDAPKAGGHLLIAAKAVKRAAEELKQAKAYIIKIN